MAVENISVIDPGGEGDYLTIAAWAAATANNLVSQDRIEVGELVAGDHTIAGAIGGATTDATHYRVLRAKAGAEYDPASGTGARVLSSGAGRCLDIREEGFRAANFACVLSGNSQVAAQQCVFVFSDTTNANGTPCYLDGLVAMVDGVADFGHVGFLPRAGSAGFDCYLRNCLAIGNGQATSNLNVGIQVEGNGTYHTIVENCGSYEVSNRGVNVVDNWSGNIVKNTWAVGSPTTDFNIPANATRSHLLSEDATASGEGSVSSVGSLHEVFRGAPVGDFRPLAEGPLHQAGRNLSSSGFTTDIKGESYGAKWNIGAYATSVANGHSRSDDTRVLDMTFGAQLDHAYISCHGYDYLEAIPVYDAGETLPGSGTTEFYFFAVTALSGAAPATGEMARIATAAGRVARPTVTSSGRTAGYLKHPPSKVLISMVGGSAPAPANLKLRVILRKEKHHGQVVGRG